MYTRTQIIPLVLLQDIIIFLLIIKSPCFPVSVTIKIKICSKDPRVEWFEWLWTFYRVTYGGSSWHFSQKSYINGVRKELDAGN